MATTVSATGAWTKDSFGGNIRIKMTVDRTAVDTAKNTSTVRSRVWIETQAPNYFYGISSTHNQTIDGVSTLSGYVTTRTCGVGESVLVMSNSRTVTHNSSGNRSVASTANWRSASHPQVSISATLSLNRIDQLPAKPGAAPTVTNSGLSVTVTSATAGANGGTITGYEARWRKTGGTWANITLNTTSRAATFTATGGTIEVQTRAKTARGWGPYSATKTHTVGTAPSTIAAVTPTAGTRSVSYAWTAPANGGLAITKYEVQAWDGRAWGATVSTGTTLSRTVSGLLPGTAVKLRARAVNAIGASGWRESALIIPKGCACAP